ELRPRVLLVPARPLDAAELLQTRIAHPRVHRRKRTDLVPDLLGRRVAPVVAQPAGQLGDDPDVVPGVARRAERLAATAHATLAGGHGSLCLAPGGRGGQP